MPPNSPVVGRQRIDDQRQSSTLGFGKTLAFVDGREKGGLLNLFLPRSNPKSPLAKLVEPFVVGEYYEILRYTSTCHK